MIYDRKKMANNIGYLLQVKDVKVGELERQIGVSHGYISRIGKDDGIKPSIEVVAKIAQTLGVSVDTLLYEELSDLTPTQAYLTGLVEKLIRDTRNCTIYWETEKPDNLNNLCFDPETGDCGHRLASLRSYIDDEKGTQYESYIDSDTYGLSTVVAGDCFHTKLNEDTYLYLMNVAGEQNKDLVIELWIVPPNETAECLASDNDETRLSELIRLLYRECVYAEENPKIRRGARQAIDDFMQS